MAEAARQDVTRILADLRGGDDDALARLLPAVYDELRALAGSFFREQRSDHTLQPTALVHEVYLRLVNADASFNDRQHFFRTAAQAMRQLLADHARRCRAERRGGGRERLALNSDVADRSPDEVDLVAFDEVLSELSALDRRQGEIVELRFLAGLSVQETAALLGVSERTVELDTRLSRAWLKQRLAPS